MPLRRSDHKSSHDDVSDAHLDEAESFLQLPHIQEGAEVEQICPREDHGRPAGKSFIERREQVRPGIRPGALLVDRPFADSHRYLHAIQGNRNISFHRNHVFAHIYSRAG